MIKSKDEIISELKDLFVSNLSLGDTKPENINADQPLFGEENGGLGLDSLDAVEIVVILQRHFGMKVADLQNNKEIFINLGTIADYIYENMKQ